MLLSLLAALATPISVVAHTASALYAPTFGACPQGFTLVRDAGPSATQQTLSRGEKNYVSSRRSHVLPQAWQSYLANVLATNVSMPDYVSDILSGNTSVGPNLGIATSGGGYRAAMFGAGVLNVLDGRNASSVSSGTGGLLQAATYLSGLSGGAWLVTSLSQANFPTIQDLVFGSSDPYDYSGWLPQFDILTPSTNGTIELQYIQNLLVEIGGKHAEGFTVTIVDVWARALSRHFLNGTTSENFFNTSVRHGAGITLSGIADL
jgi:lysophospholipase